MPADDRENGIVLTAANTVAALAGVARSASDLAPYLFLLALGFIVGAWGQSARMPIVVIAGILLILFAVGGFVIDNSTGGSGIPGLGGG
jgi:hypothetical protein